jgi:hypothetical protein
MISGRPEHLLAQAWELIALPRPVATQLPTKVKQGIPDKAILLPTEALQLSIG